jgi:hypothetical protein
MLQGSPQFTPRQLLDAGRRAEAEGKLDHAIQLYRHLTDHYAYTAEATEARNGLGRIGVGAGQQLWAENGAAPPASPNSAAFAHGRMPGPHSGARNRAVAKERHYRTGRVLATLVSWAGWMIVAAGVAMVPLGLAADPSLLLRGLPYAASMGSTEAVAAAVALSAVGLVVVFWGQMASALFDQANATRELVAIERARRDEQGRAG